MYIWHKHYAYDYEIKALNKSCRLD